MFDRVAIRASDARASARFYELLLPTLGLPKSVDPSELAVVEASEQEPVTRGLHVGLLASSVEHIGAFWRAGVEAGYASDGEPGPRPEYSVDYYGAFLLDPDGNSVEAVLHGNRRNGGLIDHVWIRVLNASMTRRFYEMTAAQAAPAGGTVANGGRAGTPGYALVADEPGLARFRGPAGGSFTVVEGAQPTTGLDMTIGGARFIDDDGRSLRLRSAVD
ncbi:MAG: VOC family protein [Solirubrobacteraceae bacterium]|nr:VOC family protein [Solirubrobacteraceae bacterium]